MRIYLPAVLPDVDSPIAATYDDATVLPPGVHPNMATLGNVPPQYVIQSGLQQMLSKNWRDALPAIVAAEETRRIEKVFPVSERVNAALAAKVGAEVDEGELKRGWDYVVAVRANAKALLGKGTLEPCSDANWPAMIEPVKV